MFLNDLFPRQKARRLWGGAATILTTNILETRLIDSKFNDLLTQAAVSAFDDFTNKTSSAPLSSSKQEDDAPSGRRRRRARTSILNNPDHPSSQVNSDHGSSSSRLTTTSNDNFFEFQRTRGYRLASPSISNCDAVRQLEEEHIAGAVDHYLRKFPSSIAKSIANELQTCGAGVSIDLWAAVQRGRGAYHAYHVHEGTIVSGVYYSSCPVGCAPLVLKRPSGGGMLDTNDEQSCYADSDGDSNKKEDVVIHPKEGLLCLFPPWLSHGVPLVNEVEHNSELSNNNLPRVSWAFNLTGRLASIGDPWSVTLPSDRLRS